MHRRKFFRSAGTVTVASLATATGLADEAAKQNSSPTQSSKAERTSGDWFDPQKCWHFFDRWHFDHLDQLVLRQGRAEFQPDATYVDAPIGSLAAWPTVFRDPSSEKWRMIYSADWKPYTMMIAESDDGRRWRPSPQPDVVPEGGKIAPHHLFTLDGGSGGAVYVDPVAGDGFPYKVFVHCQGQPAYRRAVDDPTHRWHHLARRVGAKRYINDEFTLVSRDAVDWQPRFDLSWSRPDWHPEPPIFGFYNPLTRQHSMTVRPGWGDRRQCLQTTSDFRSWSGPQLLLQPDFADEELMELYGMPVFPYGDGFVGLLWIFHCESDQPTRGFNRFTGPIDCQLAFSHDGLRFSRGSRQPLIALGEPGEPTGGAIEPSCLVETDQEIRIYSSASKVHHGRGSQAVRQGITDAASITLHTLRKDGLTYLETQGDQGRLISKPLVLLQPRLSLSAVAPMGELNVQLTDMESRPIEGFTFDDSNPFAADDSTDFEVTWRASRLGEIVGKIVRVEVRMRHARLHAIRGHFHFIDAQDRSLIQDNQPIVT